MNEEKLSNLAKSLLEIKGNVRGDVIISTLFFVREKKGATGVEELEKALEKIGHPININQINSMNWYPEGLSVLIILVTKEIFDWDDNDIFEMGQFASRKSFIMRTLMKYFVSIEKAFREASKYWDKYFDFGELEVVEADSEKRVIVIRVKDHKFHPVICPYWMGYFSKIAQICLGSEQEAVVEETKCVFKGAPYHEYLIKWK